LQFSRVQAMAPDRGLGLGELQHGLIHASVFVGIRIAITHVLGKSEADIVSIQFSGVGIDLLELSLGAGSGSVFLAHRFFAAGFPDICGALIASRIRE
jgi:hypothetical protein